MKLAVLFSGQGAQRPGMGRDLYENSLLAKSIFDRGGEEIKSLCFTGSEEELRKTHVTQPCLYTVTMAAYAEFKARLDAMSISVSMAAGFSLGEYAGWTAAGVFDFETGLSIVKKRGQWMAESGADGGGMAAVLGDYEKLSKCLETARQSGLILPVNYNCPGQTVVAGREKPLSILKELAPEYGLKFIPLKVSGAFHSPLMEPAARKLKAHLQSLPLKPPSLPLYLNLTGQPYAGQDLPDTISRQTCHPVLWEQSMRHMLADGADTFVEIGAGKTLCGLLKKVDKRVKIFNIEDTKSMDETCAAIGG